MEPRGRRASVLAMAENAVTAMELEVALVALAELDAERPGDAAIQAARRRLAGQFAAAAPPQDHGRDGFAEWRLRASTETGGAG